jgi:hypothetical protein
MRLIVKSVNKKYSANDCYTAIVQFLWILTHVAQYCSSAAVSRPIDRGAFFCSGVVVTAHGLIACMINMHPAYFILIIYLNQLIYLPTQNFH